PGLTTSGMLVRSVHDRAELAELLGRDPGLHAYELGDLDDFFWPYTTWYRHRDSVALLYHGTSEPTLIALERPERLGDLVARAGATGVPRAPDGQGRCRVAPPLRSPVLPVFPGTLSAPGPEPAPTRPAARRPGAPRAGGTGTRPG
ncbi:hypothetical protein ACFQ0D_10415, partial [Micromonospora zhanjiangensis]